MTVNEMTTALYHAGLPVRNVVSTRINGGWTAITVADTPYNTNHSYRANLYCTDDNKIKLFTTSVVDGKAVDTPQITFDYNERTLARACMLVVNRLDAWRVEITNLILEDMKS